MNISDIAAYMEWKDNGMNSPHPWFPKVVDDLWDDASLLDDTFVLSDPPEYQYPGWHVELPPEDYASSHDWTMDYDYPDDYVNEDYYDYD